MIAPVPLSLTPHQEEQLKLLASFSALSRRGGLDVYKAPALNPGTLSKLLVKGLTCSAVDRTGGGSRTVYWLTEEGAQIAARLRREAAQGRSAS